MLILSRKKNEEIIIPGVGTIKVKNVTSQNVKIGFDFEPEYRILRGEVVAQYPELLHSEEGETFTNEPIRNTSSLETSSPSGD